MNIHLTKRQIRQVYLTKRHALSTEFIKQSSEQIIEQIKKTQVYNTAQYVAYYFPINAEVDLTILWQSALEEGKHCYFPMIQANNTLLFLPYHLQTPLRLNRFRILEPDVPLDQAKNYSDMDLIFLPLVAFDSSLRRLGMGGGFYDKTLQKANTSMIGVAYECQKHPILPDDPWDIRLHKVITEQRIYE